MISNIVRNSIRKEKKDIATHYLEFKSSTPMTITPNYTNTGITLQYSLDKVTWTNISAKAVTPSASIIYFRGRATGTKSLFTGDVTSNAWVFTGATNLEVYGDITMLIQDNLGDNISDVQLGIYAFSSMFYNCPSLVKTPDLPSTTLATNCYDGMFRGCTSLTTAPALPATTLADYCYRGTFMGCSNLIETPVLPAMVIAYGSYTNMFRNCNSLVIPPELPATTLGVICYGLMFASCKNLTMLPKLPAKTLPESCYYNMFYGCTKIKLSTTKTGAYVNAYRVPITGTGTMIAGAMDDMFYGSGGTFASTPTINKTYYTENQVI